MCIRDRPKGKTPHIKPVELRGGAQWPTKPITNTPSKSTGSAVRQSPTESQKPTAGRGGTRNDWEEQPPPRPPPGENGGGGGNGNGNGGDDDGDGDGDDDGDDDGGDEDEDEEDTETVTESENGEDPNAPGGGSGCLLYTSPSPRDATLSRMPSSA